MSPPQGDTQTMITLCQLTFGVMIALAMWPWLSAVGAFRAMYELLETCASWTVVVITLLGGSGITILSVVIIGFALLSGRADRATIAPCSALDLHAANRQLR